MTELKDLLRRILIVILVLLISSHLVPFATLEQKIDVPYVPTPYKAVEEMLRLAEVNKEDVLYDLGCGDGRIVIMAAQNYHTRGVGIDIDPQRIQESKENAARAEVAHLVEFREEDFFQTDIREASVVALYLLTKINLDLRAKLLHELRPGSRVVSHKFKMDEWFPDKSSAVFVNNIQHSVFCWIVPANLSGLWSMTMDKNSLDVHWQLEMGQLFQFLQGTMIVGPSRYPLENPWLEGSRFKFTVTLRNDSIYRFEGQVEGNTMTGKATQEEGPATIVHSWEAQRKPFTMEPLDPQKSRFPRVFQHLN